MYHSWLSPAVHVGPAGAKGVGLYADRDFAAGEVVSGFGGHVMALAEFRGLPEHRQTHSLQISDDLFMVCPTDDEPADLFNHSCDPNLGILGNVLLVAMRDVGAGEELTFDYAMCDADSYDEFECACGTTACRGKVTGNDWMIPEIQQRYDGYFSTYLSLRIRQLADGESRTLL